MCNIKIVDATDLGTCLTITMLIFPSADDKQHLQLWHVWYHTQFSFIEDSTSDNYEIIYLIAVHS